MRVISGTAKGRILKYPKIKESKRLRPLSDMTKEALFNILINKTPDCYFLDLFAGTGQVGIEALSRGAKLAIFVEMDRKAAETIKENLALTGLSEKAEIYTLDVLRAIAVLDNKGAHFDIIFIGAPYTVPILGPTMDLIGKSDIINDNGIVIAEHHKKQTLLDDYGDLKKFREEKYGDTVIAFYRRDRK